MVELNLEIVEKIEKVGDSGLAEKGGEQQKKSGDHKTSDDNAQ